MKLSQDQIDHFFAAGYVLVENALGEADLASVIQEYEDYIERRARQLLEVTVMIIRVLPLSSEVVRVAVEVGHLEAGAKQCARVKRLRS